MLYTRDAVTQRDMSIEIGQALFRYRPGGRDPLSDSISVRISAWYFCSTERRICCGGFVVAVRPSAATLAGCALSGYTS